MLRAHLGPLSLVVALLVVALGAGAAQAQQTATVGMTSFAFAPTTLTATVGQEVNWTFRNNDDMRPHDFRVEIGGQMIDAAPGDANVMPGQSATLRQTFTTPGTFEFFCPVGMHRAQGMVGTLTVSAAGAAPAAKPAEKPAAAPAAKPAEKPAAAPAAQPKPAAQMPSALPRTGELPPGAIGFVVSGLGLALVTGGLIIRGRRRDE